MNINWVRSNERCCCLFESTFKFPGEILCSSIFEMPIDVAEGNLYELIWQKNEKCTLIYGMNSSDLVMTCFGITPMVLFELRCTEIFHAEFAYTDPPLLSRSDWVWAKTGVECMISCPEPLATVPVCMVYRYKRE